MPSPSIIVTDRLTLSPLVAEDADGMLELYGDERMYEFTGGAPPDLEALRARYQRLAEGRSSDGTELWFNWIVRVTPQPAPVGAMQATVTADGSSADVAWEIGVAWQGQGFAAEAATAVVEWLEAEGIHDVQALIHPRHAASAAVAARAGLAPTTERIDGEVVWRRMRSG